MISFAIEPFVGAIPIRFGMTPDEVRAILGSPTAVQSSYFGNRSESREHLSLGYAIKDETLTEVVFAPGAMLSFQGHDLFSHSDPIAFISKFDSAPQLWVGFVIFPKLGIRLSGFHDNDESQKAIGIVIKGHWDEYLEDFVPYAGLGTPPD